MSISIHPELETKIRALAELRDSASRRTWSDSFRLTGKGPKNWKRSLLRGSSLALRSRWAPPTGKTSIANSMNV